MAICHCDGLLNCGSKMELELRGSQCFESSRCKAGVAFAPGKNVSMLDRYTVELGKDFASKRSVDYVAVVSGLGQAGETTSLFIASNLNAFVREEVIGGMNYLHAIKEGCIILDERLRQAAMSLEGESMILDESGATCCALWITDKKIYCCNVGNCRILVSHNKEMMPVTRDHVPSDPAEGRRIVNAGGGIRGNKIDGKIGVSRAFGLFAYKDPKARRSNSKVLAVPSVYEVELDPKIDFFLLASGDVFQVLTSQQASHFVETHLESKFSLQMIAQGLIEWCEEIWRGSPKLQANGNLTCIIIRLVFSGGERMSHRTSRLGSLYGYASRRAATREPQTSFTSDKTWSHLSEVMSRSEPSLVKSHSHKNQKSHKSHVSHVSQLSEMTQKAPSEISHKPKDKNASNVSIKSRKGASSMITISISKKEPKSVLESPTEKASNLSENASSSAPKINKSTPSTK